MSVLAQGPQGQGTIFAKGAPESVLQRCSHVRAYSTPLFCFCLYAPVDRSCCRPWKALLRSFEQAGSLLKDNCWGGGGLTLTLGFNLA